MPGGPDAAMNTGLIFGEGDDEIDFFKALVSHLGLDGIGIEKYEFSRSHRDGSVQIMSGKDALVPTLRDLPVRTDFRTINRLCITRDVDDTPVEDVLRSIGNALPSQIPRPDKTEKVVGEWQGRRVGIFLFPGQNRRGTLEDLCLEMIQSDPAWLCIDAFFQCLDTCGIQRPLSETMTSKAKVHAWLASREVADLARLGLAARKRYLDLDHPAFDPLKTFLLALFDVPPQP